MSLYEIEYNDQKWIKIEKDESYNVVYKIPYSSIKDGVNCPIIENRFIVYILHGITAESKDYIYVGKSTKGLESRPSSHESKYNDWTYCYVLTRKDDKLFNDAVIQYIEDAVKHRVDECKDFFINTTDKTSSNTANQRDIKKSDEYLKDIYNRLFILGLDLTPRHATKKITDYQKDDYEQKGIRSSKEQSSASSEKYWHLRTDKLSVKATVNSDGSVLVYAGSQVSTETSASFNKCGYRKLRAKLVEDGIIKDGIITKDFKFDSPSAAAATILGRAANGKIEWLNSDNISFKDVY